MMDSFPSSDLGFVKDTKDHKRDNAGDSNSKLDYSFEPYTRCLIPDPNYEQWFGLLPTPILESNLEHAPCALVAYWCARQLEERDDFYCVNHQEAVNVRREAYKELDGKVEPTLSKVLQTHIADRRVLLVLGAARALAQRLTEIDLKNNEPKASITWMLDQYNVTSMYQLSVVNIQNIHRFFDPLGSVTNCANYFKQFWPELHADVFRSQ